MERVEGKMDEEWRERWMKRVEGKMDGESGRKDGWREWRERWMKSGGKDG